MPISWNRTPFHKEARKVFHIVPNSNTSYTDLCEKFGADFVFKGNGSTDNLVLATAIGRAGTQGNDVILLYPGTLVFAAAVTVNKCLTITGASENCNAAIIDCDTSNVAAFSITAAGVTLSNFSIDESNSGTVNTISSASNGIVIDNVTVQGGDIASSTATITLTGDYCEVKNCNLHLIRKGISIGGNYTVLSDNIIGGSDPTAGNFGITLTGAASRVGQFAIRNTILMSGATNPLGISVGANSDIAMLVQNVVFAADCLSIQADTYMSANTTTYLAAANQTSPIWIED